MLCMNSYTQEYIDGCRTRLDAQLAAYNNLIAAARAANNTQPAIDAFEPIFFNNLVFMLDQFFVHRTRALELKDGNPLNEVRVICNSLLNNNGKLTADKTIRLNPANSILKYKVGDEIRLTEDDFVRLSDAFFAEIQIKFCELEAQPAN